MKPTRIPDELQPRHLSGHSATHHLKRLLKILGIKSAQPSGLISSFAGVTLRFPGLSTVIKKVDGNGD